MNNYYIDKLVVSGIGKKDSIVEFSKGLNIIYGPSNTGKTYIVKCIDYLFSSDDVPFDNTLGYNSVTLIVQTKSGSVKISRKIDENQFEVVSTDSKIESGTYSRTNTRFERTINYVWLRLIGIDGQRNIIKNENYAKQKLTWRTFIHMFFLTEERIINQHSIILPIAPTGNTATISAFLFLATGNDFGDVTPHEERSIVEAKKTALITYINSELSSLADRKGELIEISRASDSIKEGNIEEALESYVDDLGKKEEEVTIALNENRQLLKQISENNERLAECSVLLNRYENLKTQYLADITRLSFIIDGDINKPLEHFEKCPVCDTEICIESTPNYLDASKAEYRRINLQVKDLVDAIDTITAEIASLEKSIEELANRRILVQQLINSELKPQISELKSKILGYRCYIESQNEIEIIQKYSAEKVAALINVETTEESFLKFRPKEHLERAILDIIDNILYEILESSNFENLTSARFDRANMDVVINGKNKSSFGKGYRAFLNTVLSTTLAKYLCQNGKYSPEILVFDSPVLSLKEPEDKISSTMKDCLFEYFVDFIDCAQVIIVENEIPKINYKNANLIQFTKNKDIGRYGFLNGVYD